MNFHVKFMKNLENHENSMENPLPPRYQKKKRRGAFGVVKLGRYHGALVATKYEFHYGDQSKSSSRNPPEAALLSHLHHPNIVCILIALLGGEGRGR